jgi:hypothetical protein
VVTKHPDECDQGLSEGCGRFVAEARRFTSFDDLVDHVNAALDRQLDGSATPSPSPA